MKKFLFTLAVTLFLNNVAFLVSSKNYETPALSEEKEATEIAVPHREIYGFFLSSVNGEGYGIGRFYMDNVSTLELLHPFYDDEAIYAGAVADGVYYACSYVYNVSGPRSGDLIAIDLLTGDKKYIGPWNPEDNYDFKVQDMTYDYANKIMYAVGFEAGDSFLFSVNLKTGELTKVCDFPAKVNLIACDYRGNLYAMRMAGSTLCSVNKETGELTPVIETGVGTLLQLQGMEFDHTDESLYWSCWADGKDKNHVHLMKMNVKDKTLEDLGIIGGNNTKSQLQGMYIPFAIGGKEVPNVPTDITITPQGKELKATLKWKNPTVNFDGEELSAIQSISIMRDDVLLITIPSTEMGKEMEWIDEHVTAIGDYKYTLYATNAVGEGKKAYVSQYIGEDFPTQVNDVKTAILEACTGVTLSWKKPTVGAHNCYFDETKMYYKIVRYPDEITVADNLKETTFTDNSVKRLASYQYEITAANEIGGTSYTTRPLILGPALDLPFTESFSNEAVYNNRWMVIDGNDDLYSWLFNSPFGSSVFGEIVPVAEYFIIPGSTGIDVNAADEWLITPPLNMVAGKQYELIFNYRCITDETLEITMGTRNVHTAQERVKSLVLDPLPADDEENNEFTECKIPLPAADGVRCVGFHLTSGFPEGNYSYLQIAYVGVQMVNEVENIGFTPEYVTLLQTANAVKIQGEFDKAFLFDINGRQISETNKASISTEELPEGIYLLKVIRNSVSKVFKVAVK